MPGGARLRPSRMTDAAREFAMGTGQMLAQLPRIMRRLSVYLACPRVEPFFTFVASAMGTGQMMAQLPRVWRRLSVYLACPRDKLFLHSTCPRCRHPVVATMGIRHGDRSNVVAIGTGQILAQLPRV
jgi:hypothetical protein